MKTKQYSVLFIVFILLLLMTSCSKKQEYDTFCTLAGIIIDYDTSNAVSSATVTLSPSGKNAYTGNDGKFEFGKLDAKQYTITVQKNGYLTNRKTVITEAGQTIYVSITLQKQP